MTQFIKQNILTLAIAVLLSIAYFAIRIPNLTYQPIFADEAIYVRWAQVMRNEPTLRFLPLSDGKTPLFMWMMIPLFKIFEDPLFAGRILSTFSGFVTILGLLSFGWYFLNRKVGLWAMFLGVITPYFLFFDRLALVDSMLAAFTIWGAFVAMLLIKYPRLDLAMLLGYNMGGAFLTKTPAMFNLVTMPISILTFNFADKFREKKIVKIFALWLVGIIITIGIYNILRLGPGFSNLNSRNQDYVLDPMYLLIRPWDPFLPHFWDLVDWLPKLFGYPLILLVIGGGIWAILKRNWLIIALLGMSLGPMVIQMSLLKTFTARYIFFSMPYLLVVAAYGLTILLDKVKFDKKLFSAIIFLILLIWPAYFTFLLHTNIEIAPIPKNERAGYLEDWTAGYGLKEIAKFFEEESKKEFIVVGTEGSFGTLPDGLQIYLDKNRQVAVLGGSSTVSAQVRGASKEHPTYFIANRSRYEFEQPALELIKEYPKAMKLDGKQDATLLFKVHPLPESTNSALKE